MLSISDQRFEKKRGLFSGLGNSSVFFFTFPFFRTNLSVDVLLELFLEEKSTDLVYACGNVDGEDEKHELPHKFHVELFVRFIRQVHPNNH